MKKLKDLFYRISYRRYRRKKRFIIDRDSLEDLLVKWWDSVDEDFEHKLDEKTYEEVSHISVMTVLVFIGKMMDYCDYKDRHMTSEEIHKRLCKAIKIEE